jgi:DNA repair protein RecO (recombination protein O)
MIDWRDEGAILSVRPHGENAAIVEVFTASHGRHAGVVRGGTGRRLSPVLQPGSQVEVVWRARLSDHLGAFTVEPVRSRAAQVMTDRLALAGLNAVTALLSQVLPERQAHAALYARSIALLDLLGQSDLWPLAYLHWEIALLEETGFALDLATCALTGTTDDLVFVSPRSGRAVSRAAAGIWADRLLPLPAVMLGQGEATGPDIATALAVTGHFLDKRLFASLGDRPVPPARARLITLIARQS